MERDQSKLSFHVWDSKQCETILQAVFRILNTTGSVIKNKEARDLLQKAGASVDGELVRIPEHIIKDAIASAPKSFTLYNQKGEPAMFMDTDHVYCGPPISSVHVIDGITGEKKRGERIDAKHAGMICEALEDIGWASAMSGVSDGVSSLSSSYEVYELLRVTDKPIMYWAGDMVNLRAEISMLETVAGGEEKFRQKPTAMCLICPMDPLLHNDDSMEQIIWLARKNAVAFYVPGTQMGVTSPITLSGSILIGLADTLVGLAVSQLANKGTPFIISRYCNTVDMKKMTIQNAHPEMLLSHVAASDVFRYIGLPFAINLGDVDSAVFDEGSAFYMAMGVYTGMLAGATMVMGLGGIDCCLTSDYLGTLFGNEVEEYVKPILDGVPVNEEELALDEIDEIGPGGNFITSDLTLERCYNFWKPDVLQPCSLKERKARTEIESAYRKRIREIIESGAKVNRSQETLRKLDLIIEEAEKGCH